MLRGTPPALGPAAGVREEKALPWYSKIAFGLNYRADVETLAGNGMGILDEP